MYECDACVRESERCSPYALCCDSSSFQLSAASAFSRQWRQTAKWLGAGDK